MDIEDYNLTTMTPQSTGSWLRNDDKVKEKGPIPCLTFRKTYADEI